VVDFADTELRPDHDIRPTALGRYDEIWEKAKWSQGGQPYDLIERSALEVSDEERRAVYESAWQEGGFKFLLSSFSDVAVDLTVLGGEIAYRDPRLSATSDSIS
jgi:hypothetical protein